MVDESVVTNDDESDEDPMVLASRVYDRNRNFTHLPTDPDDESAKIRRQY